MKFSSFVSFCALFFFVGIYPSLCVGEELADYKNEPLSAAQKLKKQLNNGLKNPSKKPSPSQSQAQSPDQSKGKADNQSMPLATRQKIKRDIMSKAGVFLDMSNMTDAGYRWTNDVVWVGADATENLNWYIAGFLFERPRHKGVWLQYAFTLNETTGAVQKFKRWYAGGSMR